MCGFQPVKSSESTAGCRSATHKTHSQLTGWLTDWQDARPERIVGGKLVECGRFLCCRKTKGEAQVSWSHLTSHNQAHTTSRPPSDLSPSLSVCLAFSGFVRISPKWFTPPSHQRWQGLLDILNSQPELTCSTQMLFMTEYLEMVEIWDKKQTTSQLFC